MSPRKVLAYINNVKEEMILAQDVYNASGTLIVSTNFKLTQKHIAKIRELGITHLWVFDDHVDGITEAEFLKMQQEKQKESVLRRPLREECQKTYNQSKDSVKEILTGFSKGKSVDMPKVVETAESLLAEFQENLDIIKALNSFKNSDDYTYTHSINVALLCSMMGKWLDLSQQEIKDLTASGLLHDLGKSKVPIEILHKPSSLTTEEYKIVKKHTVYGYKAVEALHNVKNEVKMSVLMHHERLDGSGYPLGAKGSQIPKYAQIIGIIDTFDAMTSERPYKKRSFPFDAFKELERSAFGKLNPKLLFMFLEKMASYYIGEIVRLSTGEYGEIVYINPQCVYKPIIKIDNAFVDLQQEHGVTVEAFA